MKLIMMSLLIFLSPINPLIFTLTPLMSLMLFLSLVPLNPANLWMYLTLSLNFNSWILCMMTLTLIMVTLSLVPASFKNFSVPNKMSMMLILTMSIIFFLSNQLIVFYALFEMSLIPISFMIMAGGYQPERVKAVFSMIFYTMGASLPLLVSILWFMWSTKISYFTLLSLNHLTTSSPTMLVFISFLSAFLVKTPMFSLHLWLPKAHVEAPVEGSMILAAILLKLGGFGMIQVSPLLMQGQFSQSVLMFSMIGGLMCTLICMRQIDIKVLIAYSSVAHMAFVIACILTACQWGMMMGMFVMITHSFSSSWMFFFGNTVYTRTHSRNLMMSKGLSASVSTFLMFWFFACVANMGGPPSINLWAEIMSTFSLISYSPAMVGPLAGILMLSVAYSLILFSSVSHGISSSFPKFYKSPMNLNENMMNVCSLFSMIMLFFFLNFII